MDGTPQTQTLASAAWVCLCLRHTSAGVPQLDVSEMIILNYAGGPPKSRRVLVSRAACDTAPRKRRKPQDYGGKLEGHCHSQEHPKPPGARVGSPPQLSEGAQLGSSLALRPLTLKNMGVFVGPTLRRSVTMATGQTDSREDDSPAKQNVQGCTSWESFQASSLDTQNWGLDAPMSGASGVSTVLGLGPEMVSHRPCREVAWLLAHAAGKHCAGYPPTL